MGDAEAGQPGAKPRPTLRIGIATAWGAAWTLHTGVAGSREVKIIGDSTVAS